MQTRKKKRIIYKKFNNKTFKNNKERRNKKNIFIKNILQIWKKIGGYIKQDSTTIYKHDYYLSICNKNDRNNHIHLALRNFRKDKNTFNNLCYIFKKRENNDKIIHSKPYVINFFSEPFQIVKKMLFKYKTFVNN